MTSKRYADDSPEAQGLERMGWCRASPTPKKQQPVDRWYYGNKFGLSLELCRDRGGDFRIAKTEYKKRKGFSQEVSRCPLTHDNPLSLATILHLAGDGDLMRGYERSR